jgi:glutamyl-tRNA reductase
MSIGFHFDDMDIASLSDPTKIYELNKQIRNLKKQLETARAEAIKEFVERLKPKLRNNAHVSPFASNLNDVIIDNLVKEMTEGKDDGN